MGARAAVWAATPTPCVSASALPPPPDSVPPTVPPSPGGCGRTVSEGPAGKDETTRCVIVVTLVTGGVSRSALGPSVAWAGGHMGLSSPASPAPGLGQWSSGRDEWLPAPLGRPARKETGLEKPGRGAEARGVTGPSVRPPVQAAGCPGTRAGQGAGALGDIQAQVLKRVTSWENPAWATMDGPPVSQAQRCPEASGGP